MAIGIGVVGGEVKELGQGLIRWSTCAGGWLYYWTLAELKDREIEVRKDILRVNFGVQGGCVKNATLWHWMRLTE